MTSLFSCSIFVSYLSCFMSIRLVEVNCNKIYLFRQYFIVIFIHTIFIKHYLVFAFFVLYLSIFIVFCTNSSFRYIFMPVYICNLLLANGSTSNNYSIFIKKCSCFQKRKRTQIREDTGINNVKDTDTEIIFVTVHTSLSREVFWHENAKIPRHTARIYANSINSVHREACY